MNLAAVRRLALSLIVISTMLPAAARAQIVVDMSRMTCADYLALTPEKGRMFAAWMSGWFNQKTGYVWVNLEAYARNIANVTAWCTSYPNEFVMNGLQRATPNQ